MEGKLTETTETLTLYLFIIIFNMAVMRGGTVDFFFKSFLLKYIINTQFNGFIA